MYSLRLASGTGLGFALGGKRGGGGGVAAPSGLLLVAAAARGGRSVSATSNAAAPTPGDQGVETEQGNTRDDVHKATRDVMTHSFGEGYSTRSDEEGFGGVYGRNDPVFNRVTEVYPSHPDYDTSQGSEVKEKEKARHLKDDKHAT